MRLQLNLILAIVLGSMASCSSNASDGKPDSVHKIKESSAIQKITPTLLKSVFRSTLPYDDKYKEWSYTRPIRPANMFKLEASDDDTLCQSVVNKMNQPGETEKDSLFTGKGWVEWSVIGPKPEPDPYGFIKEGYIEQQTFHSTALQFARADFDGDGVKEYVYRENASPSSTTAQDIYIFDTNLLTSDKAYEELIGWRKKEYATNTRISELAHERKVKPEHYILNFFDPGGQKAFSFQWLGGSGYMRYKMKRYESPIAYFPLFSLLEIENKAVVVITPEQINGPSAPISIKGNAPRSIVFVPSRDENPQIVCLIAYGIKADR